VFHVCSLHPLVVSFPKNFASTVLRFVLPPPTFATRFSTVLGFCMAPAGASPHNLSSVPVVGSNYRPFAPTPSFNGKAPFDVPPLFLSVMHASFHCTTGKQGFPSQLSGPPPFAAFSQVSSPPKPESHNLFPNWNHPTKGRSL